MVKQTLAALAAAFAVTVLPSAATATEAAPKAAPAAKPAAAKVIEMTVTSEGYVPDKIHVAKGEKVRLQITRKTDKTCATEIVIKDLGINQPLPLNKLVTVEFTPKKSGQLKYACGMDMISGILFVD
jgi:plastocyanin domain-containing protein